MLGQSEGIASHTCSPEVFLQPFAGKANESTAEALKRQIPFTFPVYFDSAASQRASPSVALRDTPRRAVLTFCSRAFPAAATLSCTFLHASANDASTVAGRDGAFGEPTPFSLSAMAYNFSE